MKIRLNCNGRVRESVDFILPPRCSVRPYLKHFARDCGIRVTSVDPCSWIGRRGYQVCADGYTEYENFIGRSSRGEVAFWVKH